MTVFVLAIIAGLGVSACGDMSSSDHALGQDTRTRYPGVVTESAAMRPLLPEI